MALKMSLYCNGPDCTGDDKCPHANVCMCGSPCDTHGMGDGHSPVSMHDYCRILTESADECDQWTDEG